MFWKNHRKCQISKSTKIWAVIFRGKVIRVTTESKLRVSNYRIEILKIFESKFFEQ